MQKVKIIHAADLHLDVPMKNVPNSKNIGADSTYKALENLVQFAIREKVDALLLVGDIWNHEEVSLKARLAVVKACNTLNEYDIKVFISHGNHDPLDDNFKSLTFPQNVHVFKDKYECVPLEKNNDIIAMIHGISHATKKETRNLSTFFPIITEKMKSECFHIAMLHTSLVKNDGEGVYAPCTLAELKEKNPHYWALGHVHSYQMLEENPHVVFSGALQGTHINEDNTHGCVLITIERENNQSVSIKDELIPIAPLYWKKLDCVLPDDILNLTQAQQHIYDTLATLQDDLPSCTKQVIVKITLKGQTELNNLLRNIYTIQELTDSLSEQASELRPPILVKEIEVGTEDVQEDKNIDELLKGNDFLAQVLHEAEKLFNEDDEELALLFQKLYHDSPVKNQHKRIIPMPTNREVFDKIIRQAQYICAETLEK